MKSESKVKKLVLRKETLRDLTAGNATEVKGGATGGNACSFFCSASCPTCRCHGKTYNKKCRG